MHFTVLIITAMHLNLKKKCFYHFTEYIMKQESERLMWGKGRILHHENLYELVERLKNKEIDKDSLELEQRQLEEVWERQCAYYKVDIEYLIRAVTKFFGDASRNSCTCLRKIKMTWRKIWKAQIYIE